jgi:hypothetical protein
MMAELFYGSLLRQMLCDDRSHLLGEITAAFG